MQNDSRRPLRHADYLGALLKVARRRRRVVIAALLILTCAYAGMLMVYLMMPTAYPSFLRNCLALLSGIGFSACIVTSYGLLLCVGTAVFALLNRTEVLRESWAILKSQGASICTYCGYDVRVHPQGVCPECGHQLANSETTTSKPACARRGFVAYRENPLPGLYVSALVMLPFILIMGDSRGFVLLFSTVLISIVLAHAIRLLTATPSDKSGRGDCADQDVFQHRRS